MTEGKHRHMNEKNIFEINKKRNERNQKLDIAAERLLHCVVNSEQGEFSPIYLIQDAEAQEVLEEVLENALIQNETTTPSETIDLSVLKTSIADSIYQAPEYPLGDEEVAFLAFNRENKKVRSAKLKNLFKKSQFSIVNFLMQISKTIMNLGSSLPQNETDNPIPFIFKLICCVVFTTSKLIQDSTITFDEKYCTILFELLDNGNGLLGTNKDDFVNQLVQNHSTLFATVDSDKYPTDIDYTNDLIKDLVSLGCLGEKQNENREVLIFIKEKIIRK